MILSCESKRQSFTGDFTQISMIVTIQTENEQEELGKQSVSEYHENTETTFLLPWFKE